ncbi:hypothetical protein DSECCO2_398130 [anaerobic digester metagenome]
MEIVEEHAGKLAGASGEEVGPADIADEEGVAGERRGGFRTACGVSDHVGDPVGGMARGIQHGEAEFLDFETASVGDGDVVERAVARGRGVDGGASRLRQFHVARDEVGMKVRLKDVCDGEIQLGRCIEVALHVSGRVDNYTPALCADKVGTVGDAGNKELLDKHLLPP